MGRPTKLNEQVIATMETAISSGATMNMAEAHAGIGKNSSMLWMKRGAEDEAPKIYRDFRERIMRARDKAGLRWLAEIQRIGRDNNDWRAYAWLLERNFPQQFGARQRLEVAEAQSDERQDFWRKWAQAAADADAKERESSSDEKADK